MQFLLTVVYYIPKKKEVITRRNYIGGSRCGIGLGVWPPIFWLIESGSRVC